VASGAGLSAPRETTAVRPDTPGAARPAQASSGPRQRRRGRRGAGDPFPWTMPLIGPPELRQAIAARLADAARQPGQETWLSVHPGEGQDRRDFKQETKNVAAILREFQAVNPGVAFGFEGYRDDDYPMCGFQYSAYFLWFGQRKQESAPEADSAPEPVLAPVQEPVRQGGSRASFRYALSNRSDDGRCAVIADGIPCNRHANDRLFVWGHKVCKECYDKVQAYYPGHTSYISETEWWSRDA
jgi:hypothetical protein